MYLLYREMKHIQYVLTTTIGLTHPFLNSSYTLLLPAYSDFMQVIKDALPESTFSLKLVEVDLRDETKKYCDYFRNYYLAIEGAL